MPTVKFHCLLKGLKKMDRRKRAIKKKSLSNSFLDSNDASILMSLFSFVCHLNKNFEKMIQKFENTDERLEKLEAFIDCHLNKNFEKMIQKFENTDERLEKLEAFIDEGKEQVMQKPFKCVQISMGGVNNFSVHNCFNKPFNMKHATDECLPAEPAYVGNNTRTADRNKNQDSNHVAPDSDGVYIKSDIDASAEYDTSYGLSNNRKPAFGYDGYNSDYMESLNLHDIDEGGSVSIPAFDDHVNSNFPTAVQVPASNKSCSLGNIKCQDNDTGQCLPAKPAHKENDTGTSDNNKKQDTNDVVSGPDGLYVNSDIDASDECDASYDFSNFGDGDCYASGFKESCVLSRNFNESEMTQDGSAQTFKDELDGSADKIHKRTVGGSEMGSEPGFRLEISRSCNISHDITQISVKSTVQCEDIRCGSQVFRIPPDRCTNNGLGIPCSPKQTMMPNKGSNNAFKGQSQATHSPPLFSCYNSSGKEDPVAIKISGKNPNMGKKGFCVILDISHAINEIAEKFPTPQTNDAPYPDQVDDDTPSSFQCDQKNQNHFFAQNDNTPYPIKVVGDTSFSVSSA